MAKWVDEVVGEIQSICSKKIPGRKRPALLDPSHSTFGSLPANLGPILIWSYNSIFQKKKKNLKKLISQNLQTYGHYGHMEKSDF